MEPQSSNFPFASSSAVDEAYINGVYAGLSFHSLLTYGSSHPVPYNEIKIPKSESHFTPDHPPPYKFLSDSSSSAAFSSPHHHYHQQIPNLLSLELPQNPNFEQNRKKKQQRMKLSDKTRVLQKLLPQDKKMDMATVLEEAYKYVKFLQAQVSVLQCMPEKSSSIINNYGGGVGVGDLRRLNRQELLQVFVNSPVAQKMLYSNGCCVYSMEQLILLKSNAEKRKALFHQLLFDSNFQ